MQPHPWACLGLPSCVTPKHAHSPASEAWAGLLALSTPNLPQVTPLHCHCHCPRTESGPSTGAALRFLPYWSSVHHPPAVWVHEDRARAGRLIMDPSPLQGSQWGQIQDRMLEPTPSAESTQHLQRRRGCFPLVGPSRRPAGGPQSLPSPRQWVSSGQAVKVPDLTACPGAGKDGRAGECSGSRW